MKEKRKPAHKLAFAAIFVLSTAAIVLFTASTFAFFHENVHALQCQLAGGTPNITTCPFTGYNFSDIGMIVPATNQTTACCRCENITIEQYKKFRGETDTIAEAQAFAYPIVQEAVIALVVFYFLIRKSGFK
jgi:hypothetical protein